MSEFVRRQLALVEVYAETSSRGPILGPSITADDVVARRLALDSLTTPSNCVLEQKQAIATRQAIGEPEQPVAANDNKPKPVALTKVRKSSGKSVRGSFAETLPMIMLMRNTPDHVPEPIKSNWSVDATSTIPEPDIDESGKPLPAPEIEMLLEIEPSIAKIRRNFEKGAVVRGKPVKHKRLKKTPKLGPIIKIGKLKFSDGGQTEKSVRVRMGRVETFDFEMPISAMLHTEEKLSPHIGSDPGVGMSNSRLVGMMLPRNEDGSLATGRAFIPKGDTRRGKSFTPDQSRANIARAIANTPVMPNVTICPPGIASGTSRFSDQFVGVVKASKGKGGAVQWLDVFTPTRDREEFLASLNDLDPKTRTVLDAAMNAQNFGDIGAAAGQSPAYAVYAGGGKLALIAANDNFAAAAQRRAA